jgi:hypothetical protein
MIAAIEPWKGHVPLGFRAGDFLGTMDALKFNYVGETRTDKIRRLTLGQKEQGYVETCYPSFNEDIQNGST